MPPPSLSTTAQAVLTTAIENVDRILTLPERLPIAAQRAVVKSMLNGGLIEEVHAGEAQSAWRTTESGERLLLRATEAGLAALATTHDSDGPIQPTGAGRDAEATVPPTADATALTAPLRPRARLHVAAEAVLTAWDDTTEGRPGLPDAVEALRAALATATYKPVAGGAPRLPRAGTKQQAVLTLLRRSEGATVAQVAEATGWANHTVRGFFAGLKKKGISVTVLERVRQVGPGKEGAKGSYSVYRVEEAA